MNHDIFLLAFAILSRTEFSSDGSKKDMTYRDTVKVKGTYKSGFETSIVNQEWDAPSFP